MKLTLALLLALSTAMPAHAGGPVIEDATETAPLVRSHNNRLVPILLGLAVAAIILCRADGSGSGSDTCMNDETPEPTPGEC